MQTRSRQELYQSFIEFVASDIQRERHLVNRRMISVFVWCFLMPAIISLTLLILVKLKVFSPKARSHIDWIVLVLPVVYSLYILGSEVLAQVPAAFKKGGMATTLGQSVREGEWRDRVVESMGKSVVATPKEWVWIIMSFKIDLESMQYRTRYLTALAGAVFFLLMQGIDSLDGEGKVTFVKTSMMGWVETTAGDLTQFVGLALFLILLYLSGSQTNNSLKRYLHCAELLAQKAAE